MGTESPTTIPQHVRPRHIAERLAIDVQTVYHAIYSGELPSIRFGKRTILVRADDADAWVQLNSVPTTPTIETEL